MYERWEIVSLYKEAQDKNKQIEILAELCACSKEEILNILAEEGAISGVKPKMVKKEISHKAPKRQSERGKWTAERIEELQRFLDEGIAPKEIAERMGEERQAIYDAMQRYIKKKTKKEQSLRVASQSTSIYTREAMADTLLKDKDLEKEKLKFISEMEDIKVEAEIARDILKLIGNADAGDMDQYENTVCFLLATAIDRLCGIITRAERNIEG